METTEGQPRILEETSRHFERTLKSNLAALKVDGKAVRNVASLGCGLFLEAPALKRVFPSARIVGIDRDTRSLSRMRDSRWLPQGVEVKRGDLTRPSSLGSKPYDIIIVRNPDIFYGGDWPEILSSCRQRLTDSGLVFVTCPTGQELQKALGVVEDAGFVVKIYGRNKSAIPESTATIMKDSYLMVAGKAA